MVVGPMETLYRCNVKSRLHQSFVHCLCAIKQLIGECKVPIFMSYHPSIDSKVLQMGLSVCSLKPLLSITFSIHHIQTPPLIPNLPQYHDIHISNLHHTQALSHAASLTPINLSSPHITRKSSIFTVEYKILNLSTKSYPFLQWHFSQGFCY